MDLLEAVTSPADVKAAVALFQEKLETGGAAISGFPRGRTTWNPKFGFWSHFQSWKRQDRTDRYWNGFGFERGRLRRSVVVEINPPVKNLYKGMQGVIAKDSDERLWILHRGSLSIPGKRITEDEFDSETNLKRSNVLFPDNRIVSCFPVSRLDKSAVEVQADLLRYVQECRNVRHLHMYGTKIAEDERKILSLEGQLVTNPEMTDDYLMPAQAARIIQRKHAKVWRALCVELDAIKIHYTNERVGRWGPDLRTVEKDVLFEIKLTTSASDIQKALGQLILYEALLNRKMIKTLVIPEGLDDKVARILNGFNVHVLTYTNAGSLVKFDPAAVRASLD